MGGALKQRGVTLGTTLLVAVLVAMLGLCLASASLGHLRLVSHSDSSTQALDLARSAIATAIGHMQGGQKTPEIHLTTAEGEGLLTFSSSWGIPLSLDNLDGDASVPGLFGRPLPPYSTQLVVVGRCHGVERTVLAMVHLPMFPYALASQGRLHSPGTLLVGRLDRPFDTNSPRWPASVRSNERIVLEGDSHVFGDAIAGGDIVAPADSIDGRTRPHEQAESFNRIDLRQRYDPAVLGRPYNNLAATIPGQTLSGLNRCNTDLWVNGDLILKNSLVFVRGNLKVTGTTKGTGIIVTTGDLILYGQGNLVGISRMGLMAGGQIVMVGQNRYRSIVRGTLYAEGGIDLRQVAVHGVVINLSDQLARFDDVALYYDEAAAHQSLFLGGDGDNQFTLYIIKRGSGYELRKDLPDADYNGDWSSTVVRRVGPDVQLGADEHFSGGCGIGGDNGYRTYSLDEAADLLAMSGSSPAAIKAYLMAQFTGPEDPDGEQVKVDPSEILPEKDRFRVTLWEEP